MDNSFHFPIHVPCPYRFVSLGVVEYECHMVGLCARVAEVCFAAVFDVLLCIQTGPNVYCTSKTSQWPNGRRCGVPIPLGAIIPRFFNVRCWNTMPGVSSLWCGDVSSNSHIWNASDRMVWWLCKLCHFSVFWVSYWTRGVLMWKNMPSEIQLSRKVFPMS